MKTVAVDRSILRATSRRTRVQMVSVLTVLMASMFAGAATADAQDKTCNGERVIPFTFHITAPRNIEIPLDDPIPRGEYRTNTYSFDGYEARSSETTPQPFEQWFVEFVDKDGFTIDKTEPTSDLQDAVALAEVFDDDSISLNRPAVALRLIHVHDDKTEPNSVHPGCLGLNPLTVATVPPTTAAPTTAAPTTIAPTTIAPTTVPAQVLATTAVAVTLPRTGPESSNDRGLAAVVLVSGGLALLVGSRRRDLVEG